MSLLNLEEQLVFYGQYHRNKINVIIHIVCVPLIFWSSLVWAANTGPLVSYESDSLWRTIPIEPNLGFFLIYSPLLLYMLFHATNFSKIFPDHNTLASIVHITSWVLQFIGHGFAEKRSPALKDNIIQAVLLAPLFVWLEVLFAIGYRTVLQKRIKIGVEAAIKRYNENR
ncbi:24060_t:CDS:2 [Entrophospora sp. SA101]|nr:5922_t:CDS:2 [Entrophospora sp. SA101]CAJ0749498.1 24060_t:CDS:2 [Entrophospora sp. SA101]CAJ0827816.1 6651_t:CDS:2 [Entrophospora sp. SA101]CAJ0869225.1 20009_t:CDS:2 [Entrophospora sp. SA101]